MKAADLDPRLKVLSDVRLEALEKGEDPLPHSAGVEVAELYYALVIATKPRCVVEIGRLAGYSTAYIAVALRRLGRGRVYSIEKSPREEASALLDEVGVSEFVELIDADSRRTAKSWSRNIDMLVIDGDHEYGSVKADFWDFEKHVRPGGLIIFHDSMYRAPGCGVPDLVDELLHLEGIQGLNLVVPQYPDGRNWGVAVLQRTKAC